MYTLSLHRLQLIETAEETAQWATRSRRQWGTGAVVSLRVSVGGRTIGTTPPRPLGFGSRNETTVRSIPNCAQSFSGIAYESESDAISFDVPITAANSLLVIECLNVAQVPCLTTGIAVLNASNIVAAVGSLGASHHPRQVTRRYAVHCFPNNGSAVEQDTVHAVLTAEIRCTVAPSPQAALTREEPAIIASSVQSSSFSDAAIIANTSFHRDASLSRSVAINSSQLTPLDVNFGAVRVSAVDMFFPPFLLTTNGEYIVSNVVCAMNNTEDTTLSMQLIVRNRQHHQRSPSFGTSPSAAGTSSPSAFDASSVLVAHPREAMTVRPQQRAFFSLTWGLGKAPLGSAFLRENAVVQLVVQGLAIPLAKPIEMELHCTQPQPDGKDLPFHYWVNTVPMINRPLHEEREVPYVKSVLPVFLMLHQARVQSTSGPALGNQQGGTTHDGTGAAGSSPDHIVVRDKDRGSTMVISSSPVLAPVSLNLSEGTQPALFSPPAKKKSALGDATWIDVALDRPCHYTIFLGPIRGLPMLQIGTGIVHGGQQPPSSPASEDPSNGSPLANSAPAFRIALTALQEGWSIVRGETGPTYQTQSGGLVWNDSLEVVREPDANPTMCLRLDLAEVSPYDADDEIPIGCAILSFSNSARVMQPTLFSSAFFVFDSYSLYDKLPRPSLLMKDARIVYRPL